MLLRYLISVVFLFAFQSTLYPQVYKNHNSFIIKVKDDNSIIKIISKYSHSISTPNQIFQKSLNSVNVKSKYGILNSNQGNILNELGFYYQINFLNPDDKEKIFQEISQNPDIISIEPNYIYTINLDNTIQKPNDPLYDSQWDLPSIYA